MPRSALEATSAYYGTSPVTRVFRWGLGLAQRLWPGLAVRAAHRLFCTPLPPKWMARRRPFPAGWRHEAWPFGGATLTVYRQPEAPQGPVVLLLHGWGGHAGQMLALAAALTARGLQPVLLEMPAHGRSAGQASNLPQFARALDYACGRLLAQGHALHAVVAHSLGANASALAASRGLAVQRLVLLAPPASPVEYTRMFASVFGLKESTRLAMQRRIEAREGVVMTQFEPAYVGPRIALPTLIVHDRQDSINRFADGVAYRDAIAGATLFATEGLGHRRILGDPAVLAQVAAFLS
ncbi:MAG: alpha/beta hydrolase [Polaromonas sp.]|nr:alpha/beta hydrolase [Polaromonas sp.]